MMNQDRLSDSPKSHFHRDDLVSQHLDSLVEEALASRGKRLRARLIRSLAFLGESKVKHSLLEHRIKTADQIIEWIHAGSLIVDDIQDGSSTRRGCPALHIKYGMPLALNAGNSLYFKALLRVPELQLSAEESARVLGWIIQCVYRAHEGQAIDLGVRVDELAQEEVGLATYASLESKTGALMECAAGLSAILAENTSLQAFDQISRFGRKWGIALQMFDDLGHYVQSSRGETDLSKQFEDFRNRRCTWLWAMAASELPGEIYERFRVLAIQDPRHAEFAKIIYDHRLISRGKEEAAKLMSEAVEELENHLNLKLEEVSEAGLKFSEYFGASSPAMV